MLPPCPLGLIAVNCVTSPILIPKSFRCVLYSTSEGVIYGKAWAAMAVVALPSPFAALVLLCSLLYPIDPKPPVL
jgi:hypothetical protein